MIVLITGGREYKNRTEMFKVLSDLHEKYNFTYLMHGGQRGADRMSHEWAVTNGVQPVAMPALWEYNGVKDGTARNTRMLEFRLPDLCVAFSGGRGTANMMRQAREAGVELIDVEDLTEL